ncbi:MAG: hypothetical protein RDU83_13820 [bacterium]|nr:hypothetical protein [bacterium]
MQTDKIVELARAIIYAAATGTIIHVSGTNLSHIDTQAPTAFSLNLQFAIVSSAILFIVMDGIARYCVRYNTHDTGQIQLFVPGMRFVVEILGLFAFSYWVGLLLSKSDPFSTAGYVFLFIFSASCLVNNLLDVWVVTRVEQGAGRFSLFAAIATYGSVMIWGDIAETKFGERFASIRRARKNIRQAVIKPSCQVVTGDGSHDAWVNAKTGVADWVVLVLIKIGVQGAWWRVIAQVGILHGIWFHLLAMFLSLLLVFHPVASIIDARVSDFPGWRWFAFSPEYSGSPWIAGSMVALGFVAYVVTSIKEHSRRTREEIASASTVGKPGRWESLTQILGNMLLLSASVYMWYSAPIAILYITYGILMVGAIVATMSGVRTPQPEPVSA